MWTRALTSDTASGPFCGAGLSDSVGDGGGVVQSMCDKWVENRSTGTFTSICAVPIQTFIPLFDMRRTCFHPNTFPWFYRWSSKRITTFHRFVLSDHFHGLWAESNWDLKYTKEINTLKPSTTSIPTNFISSDSGCILVWSFCYSSPVVTRRLKQIPSTMDSLLLSLLNDLAKKNLGLSLCSPRCLSRENTH